MPSRRCRCSGVTGSHSSRCELQFVQILVGPGLFVRMSAALALSHDSSSSSVSDSDSRQRFSWPPGHWALVHGVHVNWVLDEHDTLRLAE